jgi:flagellar biosynthesis chaperone FliJ
MAAFRYRLETLLEQKHEAKEAAQRKLAACRAEERAAQSQLEELEAQVRQASELKNQARDHAFEGEVSMDDVMARRTDVAIYSRRLEEARDAVLSQRIHLEELAEITASASAALTEASREHEVLAKHRAKAEAAFRAEAERKENLDQEEIAAAMFEARRRV